MDEKNKKISLFTFFLILALMVIIVMAFFMCKIYNDNIIANNKISELNTKVDNLQTIIKNNSNATLSNNEENNSMTEEAALNIVNDIYSKAYDIIKEGVGLTGTNTVKIKVGNEGTVGGDVDVSAYMLNFSEIQEYLTDRAINYIKTEFTDTPYGIDDNYYVFETNNKYSYIDKNEFTNTIFGVTDQSKRSFKVEAFNDDMIVAISNKSSYFKLDEYIILKKENNVWKIDMFESL